LSSLLLIPCTCLPAAAVYPLWAFFVPQPSVLDIVSCLDDTLPEHFFVNWWTPFVGPSMEQVKVDF